MVTFVNARKEIKTVPLDNSNGNLEQEDPSLFKRLQYAKEVLVQMMNAGCTTATVADPTREGVTDLQSNRQTSSDEMQNDDSSDPATV